MHVALKKQSIPSTEIYSDVIEGLNKEQKSLPCKYFYDQHGSELFERICKLEEYYLTRTELGIMEHNIADIARVLSHPIQLIEPGSGSSHKTRMLLSRLPNLHSYVPVDISEKFLTEIVAKLQRKFPELPIEPVAADYTKPFEVPETPANVRTVAYFPGSTIGNFTHSNARKFLAVLSGIIGKNGGLLIGYDLLKDVNVMLAAYDDKKGITAAFNKNILAHLNRLMNAGFDLTKFSHKVVFNSEQNRIEMHLESLHNQQISIESKRFNMKKGETIHTENSHKYTLRSFQELTNGYFDVKHTWIDNGHNFCIQYLENFC